MQGEFDFNSASLTDAIAEYYRRGMYLRLLRPRGKEYLFKNTVNDDVRTSDDLISLLSGHPDANIGLDGKRSRMFTFDVDVHGEKNGLPVIKDLLSKGIIPPGVPAMNSPSGGYKLLFNMPPGLTVRQGQLKDEQGNVIPGVDIVVHNNALPPSVHPRGSKYWWHVPPTMQGGATVTPELLAFMEKQGLVDGQGRDEQLPKDMEVMDDHHLPDNKPVKVSKKKGQENKQETDDDIIKRIHEKALEVFQDGRAYEFMKDVYQRLHVGDVDVFNIFYIGVGCQSVRNNRGIHLLITSPSQEGKTHSIDSCGKQCPPEKFLSGSYTPQSLYYLAESEVLTEGSVVVMDDKRRVDAGFEETIRSYVSKWTEGLPKYSVDIQGDKGNKKRGSVVLRLPPRLMLCITSKDADFSDEMLNRFFTVHVDCSEEQDRRIAAMQRLQAYRVEETTGESEDLLVCREIIRILKEGMVSVHVPYSFLVDWTSPERRNLQAVFIDTVRAITAWNREKRPRTKEGWVIASLEDFKAAVDMWRKYGYSQITHRKDDEKILVETFLDMAPLYDNNVPRNVWLRAINENVKTPKGQKQLKISEAVFTQKIRGRRQPDGTYFGGLLSKVAGLVESEYSIQEIEYSGRRGDERTHKTTRVKSYQALDLQGLRDFVRNDGVAVLIDQHTDYLYTRALIEHAEKAGPINTGDPRICKAINDLLAEASKGNPDIDLIVTLEDRVKALIKAIPSTVSRIGPRGNDGIEQKDDEVKQVKGQTKIESSEPRIKHDPDAVVYDQSKTDSERRETLRYLLSTKFGFVLRFKRERWAEELYNRIISVQLYKASIDNGLLHDDCAEVVKDWDNNDETGGDGR